jgi:hypothetical protein
MTIYFQDNDMDAIQTPIEVYYYHLGVEMDGRDPQTGRDPKIEYEIKPFSIEEIEAKLQEWGGVSITKEEYQVYRNSLKALDDYDILDLIDE